MKPKLTCQIFPERVSPVKISSFSNKINIFSAKFLDFVANLLLENNCMEAIIKKIKKPPSIWTYFAAGAYWSILSVHLGFFE